AAVVRGLGGHRPVRHRQLAPRRPDPGHAPVAAAAAHGRRRAAVMAGAVVALRGGHAVAAGRRAGLLVGLVRPRPPGLARPRQRYRPGAAAEAPEVGLSRTCARTATTRWPASASAAGRRRCGSLSGTPRPAARTASAAA